MPTKQYSSQQGFALPIAIGLGMTILLIGLSIVVRSHSDNETASAQRSNVRGLNAAEVGIERFQSLINQFRGIAKYPAFGVAPSWQSPTGISTLSSNCSGGSATNIPKAATTSWQEIDPTDANKGQYRLVSYTYDASAKQGVLVVEGRNGLNSSTTRLEIKIPVVLTTSAVPGLWVNQSLDTGTVQANLWGSCSGTFNASPVSGYTMTRTGLAMPTPPSKPTGAITLSSVSGLTLPQPSEISSQTNFNPATGAYEYAVDNISGSFSISPGQKVHVWVDGDINLQGGAQAILRQCSTSSSDPCSPFDVRIYGMAANGTISLGEDSSVCNVFIWAPTYNTVLNGGGSALGCGNGVNNNGIYWVKSWSGGGQGGHIALSQAAANWSQSPIQPLPKIAPIKSWQREQTN